MATMYEDRSPYLLRPRTLPNNSPGVKIRLVPSADLNGPKNSALNICQGCSRYDLRPRSEVGILSHESERMQLRKKPLFDGELTHEAMARNISRPRKKLKLKTGAAECGLGDRLFESWNEDGYEGSEASKIRDETRYEVAAAVDKYNSLMRKNVEIVKTGCLAVGNSPEGRVVHMNLEAKDKDDPDASLQTFFIELLLTDNDISTTFFRLLGTPDMLPKKADTRGCVYCHGRGIHHPKVSGYRCGREHLYPILLDKIQKMLELAEGHKTHNIGIENVEQDVYMGCESFDALADRCAMLALGQYNAEEGANFELVETYGLGGAAYITPGFIMHMNFVAKNKDDPGASVETFFAEAIKISTGAILVTFCKSLGTTDSLPDEADLCGCKYCCDGIYHPPCAGYLIGRGRIVCKN